jgi:hypothetical protein
VKFFFSLVTLFFRKKERSAGYPYKTSQTTSTSTSTEDPSVFEYIGVFLLVTVPLCFCISFLFFWRRFEQIFSWFPPLISWCVFRYKQEGDPNEGFATFVTEEVADIISAFSSKQSPMSGISATHFGDEESDESQHSTHPMVTSGSSSRTAGKAKLSTIKSGSKNKSPKKTSGYSGASMDESQDGL